MDKQTAMQFSRRFSDGNCFPGEKMTVHLWEICVKKMRKNPAMIQWLLGTWTPEMNESAEFLGFLTAGLPPEWWGQRKVNLKIEILKGLIFLDDGRGIIADWLAAGIRDEQDWNVLETAARWKPRGGVWPAVVLDAWSSKTGHGHPDPKVTSLALRMITSANLSPEKSPTSPLPETWSEEERVRAILKYLPESKRYDLEALNIITGAMASPGLYHEKIATALLLQWNDRMRQVAGEHETGWQSNDWELKEIWQGMIRIARYCPDALATEIILPWIEYWLSRETNPEVLWVMAEWQPADKDRQRQLMELWGRHRVSSEKNHRWAAWKFGWRFLTQERKPGPGWEATGNNCLESLRHFLETARISEPQTSCPQAVVWLVKADAILEVIEPPSGLTRQEMGAWERLWMELLQSSDREVSGSAAIHLLKLAAAGTVSQEQVKTAILRRLETSSASAVEHLLGKIAAWENSRPEGAEVFSEVCSRLSQSVKWNDTRIRLAAVKQLLSRLENVWQQGGDDSQLVLLWLDTLHKESDPEITGFLGEWEVSCRERQPMPDWLSDPLRKSGEIWKERGKDSRTKIRETAWKVLGRMGEASGEVLVERLSREWDYNVLSVMADWNPPPGKPLPSGFWEAWGQGLRKLLNWYKKDLKPDRLVSLAARIGTLFVTAGFSDKTGKTDWWEKDLIGLWNFSNELATILPDEKTRHLWQERYRTLKVLSALKEPPEIFQSQLFNLKKDELYNLMKILPDTNLLQGEWESRPTANMTYNLPLVAACALNDWSLKNRCMARSILMNIWKCGAWGPGETLPGWNRFCKVLQSEIDKRINRDELCQLIQTGRTVKAPCCRYAFHEIMKEAELSGDTFVAGLAGHVFWCRAATAWEEVILDCPEERKVDWQTEWRWLRQFIHTHHNPEDARKKMPEEGKNRKFKNSRREAGELWEHLKMRVGWDGLETDRPETGSEKTEKQKAGKEWRLEGRPAFFCDPRETVRLPADKNAGKMTVLKQPCRVSN